MRKMNVLDSMPLDIFQMIIEELSLPTLSTFASARKSHASVHAKAMHARLAQLKEEEGAAAAEALRSPLARDAEEEEATWFHNGDGNIEDGGQGTLTVHLKVNKTGTF